MTAVQRAAMTRTSEHPDNIPAHGRKKAAFAKVDALLNQNGPLDEHEQERLIQEFELMQLQQARTWKVGKL